MSSPKSAAAVYFPGLNGIRFIAAMLVVIHHIEQIKMVLGLPNRFSSLFFERAGGTGVTLFFVLSGFLITYLLLKERDVTGTVAIKDFYVRRVLRIWPLYYLVFAMSFFILPGMGLTTGLEGPWYIALLYIFLLPNIGLMLAPGVMYGGHLWSIGVEEQFYLVWPWLVKKIRKSFPLVLISIILLLFIARAAIEFAYYKFGMQTNAMQSLLFFFSTFRIDCMAIGALGAWWYYHKQLDIFGFVLKMEWIYSKWLQLAVWLAAAIIIAMGMNFKIFTHQVYSVIFIVVILNVATNPRTIVKLEYPVLSYLGKISYGLYMFHPVCIGASVLIARMIFTTFNFVSEITVYALSILFTIGISMLSYHFFERYFLLLKQRFMHIISVNSRI
jgi:peptidoglycan/LPS O-acetylase OafA/YrhL